MFTPDMRVSVFFFSQKSPLYGKTQLNLSFFPSKRYANATLNQPCIIENTTYVTDLHIGDPNGDGEATYIMNVIKHNCRSPNLFFCDPDADLEAGPICQPTKELKKNCRFDAECASVRYVLLLWKYIYIVRIIIFFLCLG